MKPITSCVIVIVLYSCMLTVFLHCMVWCIVVELVLSVGVGFQTRSFRAILALHYFGVKLTFLWRKVFFLNKNTISCKHPHLFSKTEVLNLVKAVSCV